MSRLTERFSNGQAAVLGCGDNCKWYYKYCKTYNENCPALTEIYEKLAAYEDLEEQGLLLRLPCKAGDRVWLMYADGSIEEHTVSSISLGKTVDRIYFEGDSCYTVWDRDYSEINKWFFLTKEEAEAALEKMKGEEHDTGKSR